MDPSLLSKQNPVPFSLSVKGFVGKFYMESPFLTMYNNNYNNTQIPFGTTLDSSTIPQQQPQEIYSQPNNMQLSSLQPPMNSEMVPPVHNNMTNINNNNFAQSSEGGSDMGNNFGDPSNTIPYDNNFMNNNNFMSNDLSTTYMPSWNYNPYDPTNYMMNSNMMYEQMMMEQQLAFNNYMDEIKLKASIAKDKNDEATFISYACYGECIKSYNLNLVNEIEKQLHPSLEYKHLSHGEIDCIKDCVSKQKKLVSHVLKRIYAKMAPNTN
ncbi:hypothetical protein FDP41_005462 [Naegleria fowleri]|uniref:Tim10-like domain-containing protein n=1 Tax=Naegleria fowleri TaxID=5763 RepID=A0A6A5BMU6_NAEFO|nr:uncharacterized protein FDP41_005462 [Naegleria fowleri]KAF0975468.1 hypothetical protein FDP41_005462 [Naegleria fowleri]CAG4709289.1 unnamed protein product [Naegleria fowleri]